MMRTVEILIVIVIMTGAFLTASFFAALPSPRQVSPINLNRLALTTLQTLDAQSDLSTIAFDTTNDTAWNQLQIALSACLPPNIVYNLTAYDISTQNGQLYNATSKRSISNVASLGLGSDVASYMVASSNVTFSVTPQKIGATLYILNCSDSSGWWITGYTVQSLAQEFSQMFASYFEPSAIIMVQNTTQLGQLLGPADGTGNGQPLQNETIQNAIVINTCGEAVPIPQSYASLYSNDYAKYSYQLGRRVNQYNWTWVSIVGYPLYYVSNTLALSGTQNSWGIYGMKMVAAAGLNAFLKGIDLQTYSYDNGWLTADVGVVTLSPTSVNNCSYYGIFPSPTQTATRALPTSITTQYHLTTATMVFNAKNNAIAGAVFNHISGGDTRTTGSLFALGITRVPDIRLVGLGILSNYNPVLYKSLYTTADTSKLVVLQLGLAGGK
jgi:hypothetical protein